MKFKFDLQKLATEQNICEMLDDDQLKHIANQVIDGFRTDLDSRREWEKLNKNSNKLALQIMEHKNHPWPGASNVKFPLLTVATLQFSARAYPALVTTPEIVKCRTIGMDPMGEKKARASRVSQHMSYQILEEDECWEEHHDKLLMVLPVAGSAFKKTYYDGVLRHNKTELVLAQDLIINYYTSTLEEAERLTHRYYLFKREIREREINEIYQQHDHGEPFPELHENEQTPDLTASDERQGLDESVTDDAKPFTILEQHCYMDLDGDGYDEPYVATVVLDSGKLVRLVNRFDRINTEQDRRIRQVQKQLDPLLMQAEAMAQANGQLPAELTDQIDALQLQIVRIKSETPDVLSIEPIHFFTKYPFIPSPDGGIYDLGFGALLGPINESVNTLINQLIDAGTMQNGSMGFIGRGGRQKGGELRFRPYEWKRVDVPGGQLRDSIVPLPINPPSPVLFNMLSLLVTYGERIGSVTDVMVGESPGQNTPAYNMQQMQKQGMAVFSGIFKRIHRAMRDEFRKLYRLNYLYLDEQEYFQVLDGPSQDVFRIDYMGDPRDIKPAADPNTILSEEKMRQALLLSERSRMVPGYNMPVVETRLLEAMGIQDVQEVFPLDENGQPAIQPPPNPEMELQLAEEQRRGMEAQNRDVVARQEAQTKSVLASAQIEEIEARVIKLMAEAGSIEGRENLEKEQMMLNRIAEQRAHMEMIINAENEREKIQQERARAMAGKPGNGAGTGSA